MAIVYLDHVHNRTESPEEAADVVAQVDKLLGTSWSDPDDDISPRPLAQIDFLVVAPYNAQVNLIRTELEKAGYPGSGSARSTSSRAMKHPSPSFP